MKPRTRRNRQLTLSMYVAALVHLLVLQVAMVARSPVLAEGNMEMLDRRGLIFVDTVDLPPGMSEEPSEPTRVIGQDSYRASDRLPGAADEVPTASKEQTDAPHDVRDSAERNSKKPDESKPGTMELYRESAVPTRTATGEGAANAGALMYNVKKHEYADYYKHIRDRIILSWQARYSHDLHRLLQKNYKATVLFRINRDGSITGVRPGPDQTANLELVTTMMQVISSAGPLNSFPEKITEPYLKIRFDFYFF